MENPGQPAAEPRGAVTPRSLRIGRYHPAREPARVDPVWTRRRVVSARHLSLSPAEAAARARVGPGPPAGPSRGPEHGLRAGIPDARLPPVPRLGDGAGHRPDAREARHHAAPPAGLGGSEEHTSELQSRQY